MEWESQVNDVYEVDLYVSHTVPFDGLNTMFTRTRSSPSLHFAELLLGVYDSILTEDDDVDFQDLRSAKKMKNFLVLRCAYGLESITLKEYPR